jgi:hypothetical protein
MQSLEKVKKPDSIKDLIIRYFEVAENNEHRLSSLAISRLRVGYNSCVA